MVPFSAGLSGAKSKKLPFAGSVKVFLAQSLTIFSSIFDLLILTVLTKQIRRTTYIMNYTAKLQKSQ